MKRTLTEISEVYAVFSRRISDGTTTLMWIETDKKEAETDCTKNSDNEYDWYFTCEKVYGNLWKETIE